MSMKPDPEPIERDGFCQGCKKYAKLFRVAPSRYRCIKCCKKEK